ncbi:MAG: hypothetical protein KC620_11175 [Myxococcales bacterium]|nr:hypothetical protein [Myxococcales bacterium]
MISQYLTQPSDRKLAGITKVFLSGNASLMELNLSGIEEARALNQIRTDPGGTLSQLASVVLVNLCDVGARFLPCRR